MPRPNILFIMTDQQASDALSCAGNTYLQTPSIDRIAADGVRFDTAYCTQPLCVPSRASFITGRFPHEVGVPYNLHDHECPEAANVPWLGKVLGEAGYETAWVGKWHLPAPVDDVETHGFEITREARGNRLDDLVAPHCREILGMRRERPLFLAASFVNPHDCCEAARDADLPNGMIDNPPPPEQCPPLPPNFTPPENESDVLRNKVQPLHPRAYPSVNWDEGRWRQYLWQYARLTEKVDALIGQVLDALEASGLADNTLVVFTSDHGDGTARHCWNQKQVLYDPAAKVPMLLREPGGRSGAVDSHLVSLGLDLLPTLCDYADADVPAGLNGRSLRPLVNGRNADPWREALYCETEFAQFGKGKTTGVKGRMVRTDRYKYVVYSEGCRREQFFDMQADPGEQMNLIDDPSLTDTQARHRRLLADWCRRTNDDFPLMG